MSPRRSTGGFFFAPISATTHFFIYVVVHQTERLQKSADSIVSENLTRLQNLVVYGGSTEGRLDVLESKRSCRCIGHKSGLGISPALKKGKAMVEGDVGGILNASDWYVPDTLALIVQAHNAPKLTWI